MPDDTTERRILIAMRVRDLVSAGIRRNLVSTAACGTCHADLFLGPDSERLRVKYPDIEICCVSCMRTRDDFDKTEPVQLHMTDEAQLPGSIATSGLFTLLTLMIAGTLEARHFAPARCGCVVVPLNGWPREPFGAGPVADALIVVECGRQCAEASVLVSLVHMARLELDPTQAPDLVGHGTLC